MPRSSVFASSPPAEELLWSLTVVARTCAHWMECLQVYRASVIRDKQTPRTLVKHADHILQKRKFQDTAFTESRGCSRKQEKKLARCHEVKFLVQNAANLFPRSQNVRSLPPLQDTTKSRLACPGVPDKVLWLCTHSFPLSFPARPSWWDSSRGPRCSVCVPCERISSDYRDLLGRRC